MERGHSRRASTTLVSAAYTVISTPRKIEESEHRGEHAVHRSAAQETVHDIGAKGLQHRPCDASGDRARHHLAGRDALGGQDAKADEVHADVGRDGESLKQDQELAILAVDLAPGRQAAVACAHDLVVLGRRVFTGSAWCID